MSLKSEIGVTTSPWIEDGEDGSNNSGLFNGGVGVNPKFRVCNSNPAGYDPGDGLLYKL